MAGDPIYGDTTTTPTNIYEGTTSTTASYYDTDTSYSVTYTIIQRVQEDSEKVKELIKKQVIQEMKETWHNFKKQFYTVPPVRPEIQLRGVCFGGRGWA